MTETLTGKQVLALLVQDEVPEIEVRLNSTSSWAKLDLYNFSLHALIYSGCEFRIKPKPARRLSVTLANGEVVSWPEPVREKPKHRTLYFAVMDTNEIAEYHWESDGLDRGCLAFGNVHLTREAAQEHADALRLINNQTGQSNA